MLTTQQVPVWLVRYEAMCFVLFFCLSLSPLSSLLYPPLCLLFFDLFYFHLCFVNTFFSVPQSFYCAIESELNEYYRLLAVLEANLNHSTNTNNDSSNDSAQSQSPRDASDNNAEASNRSNSSGVWLTCRRLEVWLSEPLERLSILCTLLEASAGHKGGELISLLTQFTNHGNPKIRAILSNILNKVNASIN